MSLMLFHPGLEGVIAGETNISCEEGEFVYRGYPVGELAEGASFLEVAHLLLAEELPTEEQLADFRSLLWDDAALPDAVGRFVQDLPLHVGPLEMLRTGVTLLANTDPQLQEPVLRSGVNQAIRLMARVPLMLGEWRRLRDGGPPIEPSPVPSYSCSLLTQLTGREPTPTAERAFQASLIISADHGFNPSTFAARLAASAGADLASSVTAAIATLAGRQRPRRYTAVLDTLAAVGDAGNAERWVNYRLGESLPLPGFCENGEGEIDPRVPMLGPFCREMATELGCEPVEELAAAIARSVWKTSRRSPTLEWPTARLYDALGIDRDLHLPAFVCGRLVGWCAHAIEQAEAEEVIRPRSRYRGAEHQVFEPLYWRE